ncbi:cytidine aminohydrolase, putative [Candida dubliniensis CD36]|uniref:Cytidine deaminase n=1 Tax=Candida dubliniensis (strain CD36 / ATCC MYA-646 / CBS 7987 / NCPF 3949 / NRRL Y-17841) TaxID=573826 RepID=B9WF41_CANDC|nr:cytidine aminohydrolase, putative [Candida dubliniensis CD36]CAX42497.1 cytidine aminohydrolase, putative [Candida dubliniensis CD36]
MSITKYTDHKELSDTEFSKLKENVIKAKSTAYCPYSKFRVGCALLTESGEFISGANVENASYGAGVCAERTAIVKAVTEGHTKFKAIAVAGNTKDPITPCGICRQFIREFAPEIPVFMFNEGNGFIKVYLQDLLPLSFGPEDLGVTN